MSSTRLLVVFTLAGLFLPANAGMPQAGQSRDERPIEEAVLAVDAEMARAAEAGDVERLFTFVLESSKGSIIQDGVFLPTREDALERVTANLRGIRHIEYRWKRRHVTVLSPDAALLTAEGESVATTTEGQVFTTPFAQTVVFLRREGGWKALHAHQSSLRVQ